MGGAGTSIGRTLRVQLALLVVFVAGSVAYVLVATPVFLGVVRFLGEGPFSISVDNRSDQSLVVRIKQVGATSGRTLDLPPATAVGAGWSGCADTEVVVRTPGRTGRDVSRGRLVVCEGDVVIVDEHLRVVEP